MTNDRETITMNLTAQEAALAIEAVARKCEELSSELVQVKFECVKEEQRAEELERRVAELTRINERLRKKSTAVKPVDKKAEVA